LVPNGNAAYNGLDLQQQNHEWIGFSPGCDDRKRMRDQQGRHMKTEQEWSDAGG